MSLRQSIERELVNEREAAEHLGMSLATLRRYRYGIDGRTDGPSVVKIGRTVRYALSDLRKFKAAHTVGPVVAKQFWGL